MQIQTTNTFLGPEKKIQAVSTALVSHINIQIFNAKAPIAIYGQQSGYAILW